MRILVVDDEKIVRKGIITILKKGIPEAEIVGEASDGSDAFSIVRQYHPDIVITDVKMPTIDGMELIRLIHEYDTTIKIIVLSGYDDYTYVRQCMKNGALDYLLKPVDKHELLSLLNLLSLDNADESAAMNANPNEIIDNAKNYIRKHYCDDISLTSVANYVHLNPSYFSNLFRVKTGTNFSSYLNNVRIARAKQLLLNPNIKMYEICEAVGFSDSASFNRSFKRAEGISPSKFREQFHL